MLLFAVFNTKGTTVNNNFNDVWLYLVCLYFFSHTKERFKSWLVQKVGSNKQLFSTRLNMLAK